MQKRLSKKTRKNTEQIETKSIFSKICAPSPGGPNYEHGSYDDDDDIEEEAPTGDTDVTVT